MTSTLIAPESLPETLANPSLAARPRISRDFPVWLVLGLCAAAFAHGVTTIRSAAISDYGLLAAASPAYALSILLAGSGFAMAIRRRNFKAAVTATVLMIAVQRLPTAVATDTPMYPWTYKHLGVVDYIQHEHTLARGVDVYAGWPGVFAVTAWFSDLTGVSPIAIAHWFTVSFHLAFALMVYAAARTWGLLPLTAVTAMFITVSLNWIGQDYYSPQAMAMIFAAALFIMVGLSRTKPVGVALTILLFAAVTITHQLTPPWVFMAISTLAFTRKLKPWWLVIPLAAILFGFLLYNFDMVAEQSGSFSLNIFGNTGSAAPPGCVGQRVTSLGNKFLSGLRLGGDGGHAGGSVAQEAAVLGAGGARAESLRDSFCPELRKRGNLSRFPLLPAGMFARARTGCRHGTAERAHARVLRVGGAIGGCGIVRARIPGALVR